MDETLINQMVAATLATAAHNALDEVEPPFVDIDRKSLNAVGITSMNYEEVLSQYHDALQQALDKLTQEAGPLKGWIR